MVTTDDLYIWKLFHIEFNVLEGVFWGIDPTTHLLVSDSMTRDYQPFIREFYDKRMEYKQARNKVLDGSCKLLLNGTFGSTGQRAVTEENTIVDCMEEVAIPDKYKGVAKVSGLIPIRGGTQGILSVKANANHTFSKSSCKSTITSRILSASRRLMFESMHQIAQHLQMDMVDFTNQHIFYMDTDSMFCGPVVTQAMKELQLTGSELGKFSPDYDGYMIRMFAPAPKIRHMTLLVKVEGVWKIKTVSKLKGLPLIGFGDLERNQLFQTLETNFSLKATKDQWSRKMNQGVVTDKIPHELSQQGIIGRTQGFITYMDMYGNLFQKLIHHGVQVENEWDVECLLPPNIPVYTVTLYKNLHLDEKGSVARANKEALEIVQLGYRETL